MIEWYIARIQKKDLENQDLYVNFMYCREPANTTCSGQKGTRCFLGASQSGINPNFISIEVDTSIDWAILTRRKLKTDIVWFFDYHTYRDFNKNSNVIYLAISQKQRQVPLENVYFFSC